MFPISFSQGGIEDFKILLERNIFDPNRNAPVVIVEPEVEIVEPVVQNRIECLELTGAMSMGVDSVAFFESSLSSHPLVGFVGSEIVDYYLIEIHTDKVLLFDAEKIIELYVGKRLEKICLQK